MVSQPNWVRVMRCNYKRQAGPMLEAGTLALCTSVFLPAFTSGVGFILAVDLNHFYLGNFLMDISL